MRRLWAVVIVVAGLLGGVSAAPAAAQVAPSLSTPELLDAAVASGAIDRAQADLHLAQAFGDPASLPAEYRSNVPWDGTGHLQELQERLRHHAARTSTRPDPGSTRGDGGQCGDHRDRRRARHLAPAPPAAPPPRPCRTRRPAPTSRRLRHDRRRAHDRRLPRRPSRRAGRPRSTSFGWAAPPVKLVEPAARQPLPRADRHPRRRPLRVRLERRAPTPASSATTRTRRGTTATPWRRAWCSTATTPGSPARRSRRSTPPRPTSSTTRSSTATARSTAPTSPTTSFVEGGATWMEDEVHGRLGRQLQLPAGRRSRQSLGDYDGSPYPYWIVLRGLTERFGDGRRRRRRAASCSASGRPPARARPTTWPALAAALAPRGRHPRRRLPRRRRRRAAFMRTCGGGYASAVLLRGGGRLHRQRRRAPAGARDDRLGRRVVHGIGRGRLRR